MYKKIKAEDLGNILLVNDKNGVAMMLKEALRDVTVYRKEEEPSKKEIEEKALQQKELPKKEKRNPIDRGKVMALARGKWTVKEIAEEMHCSGQTIRTIIAELKKEGKLDGEPAS